MVAVLLGWNPGAGTTWPEYSRVVDELAAAGVHRRPWRILSSAGVSPGADAWLFLVGKAGRGLIGHGVTASPPYRPASEEKAGVSGTVIDVDFDALLPLGDQIPLDVLTARAPMAGWNTVKAAGRRIPEEEERAVRAIWAEHLPADVIDPILPVPGTAPQDALTRVGMNRYERSPQARRICLAHHGTSCAACGFSFEAVYGPEGEGFIHVHHLTPVSQLGPGYELDPIGDLVPLCPNCHYMAHRRPVPYTPAELRAMMSGAGHIAGSVLSQQELEAQAAAQRILESR